MKKTRHALTISDLLTTPQFHRTAIYNEFYRIYGIDHQLMAPLQIADDQIVTYTYNRIRSDFSDEERLISNLFAPHLNNAIRNGRMVEKLLTAASNLNSALSDKSIGVASFDQGSKLKYLSDHGQVLLDKFYGRYDFRDDGVPKRFAEWVTNCDARRTDDPMISEFKLKLEMNDSTLCLTVVFDDAKREIMVLLDEQRKPSPIGLHNLGLTRRQSEILFWVSQGKTDKDIGGLLGISPRTVHKHLENIYIALGVETRTSAMLRAIESL